MLEIECADVALTSAYGIKRKNESVVVYPKCGMFIWIIASTDM